jgi:phosphomannomutase
MADDLITAANQWIAGDPDPETRSELQALVDAGALGDLQERIGRSLMFGTAGLRAAVGAGSNRMNRAVVIRTTRGLADYLAARDGATEDVLVIGADARVSSATFLEDAVGVLVAAGIAVRYFRHPVPTPVVAYAARMLKARAAVVITASHNPPQDNGYKVYDRNGAQIVPPVDRDIAAAIDRVGPAATVPRTPDALGGGVPGVTPAPRDTYESYLTALEAVRVVPAPPSPDVRIVHTPIHGVGGRCVVTALERSGYPTVLPVLEQFEPDGHFPTVAFPNPEEPGALDLATALARRERADVILANDPDTDRLAVSLPLSGESEEWRALTGNQIGVLLGDFVLEHTSEPHPLVGNSIVSSPMLGDIAAAYGARYVQTLTGFKWIWNAALDIEAAGPERFVFGYEEALGYSVGRAVRDKDGISAAVVFADLVAACEASGITVWDRLAGLYRRHGMWASLQKSVLRPGEAGAAEIAAAMDLLGRERPAELAGKSVTAVTDYRTGGGDRPRYLAAATLVELTLGTSGRVLVRPSGTEPKLKIYVDLRVDLAPEDDVWAAEADLLESAAEAAEEIAAFLHLG